MKQRQIPTKQIQILTIQKLEGGRGAVTALAAGEWALLALTALFLCALAFLHAHPGLIAPETEIYVSAEESADTAADIPADRTAEELADTAADIPADRTAEELADTAADIPADRTAEESADTAADIPADTAAEESADTAADTPANDLLNVNTASAEELTALPGIGPVLAGRIVDYRTEHGPFAVPDDLRNVKGIGAAKLAAIRDLVTCG